MTSAFFRRRKTPTLHAIVVRPAAVLLTFAVAAMIGVAALKTWLDFNVWSQERVAELSEIASTFSSVAARELVLQDSISLDAARQEFAEKFGLESIEVNRVSVGCPAPSFLKSRGAARRTIVCAELRLPYMQEEFWVRLQRLERRLGVDHLQSLAAPVFVVVVSWIALILVFLRRLRVDVLEPVNEILGQQLNGLPSRMARTNEPPLVALSFRSLEMSLLSRRVVAVVNSLRDANETRRALERGAVRAEAVLKTFQGLSHDIRQPLQAFQHLVETFCDDTAPVKPDDTAFLADAARRVRAQMTLVDACLENLRALSRADAFMPTEVAFEVFMEEVWNGVFSEEEQGNIHREFRVPPGLVTRFDDSLMRRVFSNLLRNAYEAASHPFELRVSAGVTGDLLRVRVWNSRSSIAEEHIERVFEEAFSTKEIQQGEARGTGLALARAFVDLHGGVLDCRNEEGGVSFFLVLPQAMPNAAPEMALELAPTPLPLSLPMPMPKADQRHSRVHVIDDNPLVRRIWARGLGETVSVFHTPEEFLKSAAWRELAPGDVVVSDLDFAMASDMTGVDLLEKVRGEAPQVRRLLSTSLPDRYVSLTDAVEELIPKTSDGVARVKGLLEFHVSAN
ncbi:MAG: hypothetical protein IOD12_03925 [Silvanigrellales bacterium]|nr:hypothetical protein [Silvanigrellales bacterium]